MIVGIKINTFFLAQFIINPFRIGKLFKNEMNYDLLDEMGLINIKNRVCEFWSYLLVLESKGRSRDMALLCCNKTCRK